MKYTPVTIIYDAGLTEKEALKLVLKIETENETRYNVTPMADGYRITKKYKIISIKEK